MNSGERTVCFGPTRSKSSRGSVPVGLVPVRDSSFCLRCEVGSSLAIPKRLEQFFLQLFLHTGERV